jgi:hypothetical protein
MRRGSCPAVRKRIDEPVTRGDPTAHWATVRRTGCHSSAGEPPSGAAPALLRVRALRQGAAVRPTLVHYVWLLVLTMPLVRPAGLEAQPATPSAVWLAPLDITHGFTLGRGSPVPFTAMARLQLARGFGEGARFRVGPSAAVLYVNPDWEAALGLAAAVRLVDLGIPMLTGWGVYLQGEQLVGTGDVAPAAVAVLADLGVVRVGVRGSHDWRRDVQTVEGSIGVGLHALIALLRPTPPREPIFDLRRPGAEPRP